MITEQKKSPLIKPEQSEAKNKTPPRSFLKNDFPLIRQSVLTLTAVVGIGVMLIVGSGIFLDRLRSGQAMAQTLRDQAREKYAEAENEKRQLREFQPKFEQLRTRGFIGEENRLELIEHLRSVQQRLKLFPLSYEIAAQRSFQVEPSLAATGLELRGSKLTVRMQLLHEMDLFNFIDNVKAQGMYVGQSCDIMRVPTTGSAFEPHLAAECALYWMTLGDKSKPTTAKTGP